MARVFYGDLTDRQKDENGASRNRVLEIGNDVGKCRSETDDHAGDQGTSEDDGNHAGKDEKGRVDSLHPDGGRLHALLRPIERGMPLAGVLLAERLLQDESLAEGTFGSVTSPSVLVLERRLPKAPDDMTETSTGHVRPSC